MKYIYSKNGLDVDHIKSINSLKHTKWLDHNV